MYTPSPPHTRARRAHSSGFSLLELGIVLTIVSTLVGAAVLLAERFQETSRLEDTAQTIAAIEEAIERYIIISGRLPCPAQRDQAPDSAGFGVASNCAGAAPSGTTDISTLAGTSDDVRIGVVPTRELNLPDRMMFDSWGSRLTYVVVKDLAINQATFDAYVKPASGGIILTDSAGNSLIDNTTGSDMLVAYIVLSHGKDKKGAPLVSGAGSNACTAGFGDSENCDNDATFIDTTVNNEETSNTLFFNDIIAWKSKLLIDPNLR